MDSLLSTGLVLVAGLLSWHGGFLGSPQAVPLAAPEHTCRCQVEVELTYDEDDLTAPKVRGVRPKKVVPAGRLVGQILFDGAKPTPEYKQLGSIVERLVGVS